MAEISDKVSYYAKWAGAQGIPIFEGFYVEDVNKLGLGHWEKIGADASLVHLTGAGQLNNGYVGEIPPSGNTKTIKHMYEEIVYITQGHGATVIRNETGQEVSFEWQAGSLFAIPLNASYQHFNGSGQQAVRFYAVTSAPLMMNLIRDDRFLFGLPFDFAGRWNEGSDFSGGGTAYDGRVWETNFVSDVASLTLENWDARGKGSSNRMLELADGSLCAHVSQFPVGTYKKAHRHGAGAHVIIVEGEGYSLLWEEGEPVQRVDWKPGSIVVPPENWFHQHFNLSPKPARYLAMRWGSRKNFVFPRGIADRSIALGGNQIETEDEAPEIRATFLEELRVRGIESGLSEGA